MSAQHKLGRIKNRPKAQLQIAQYTNNTRDNSFMEHVPFSATETHVALEQELDNKLSSLDLSCTSAALTQDLCVGKFPPFRYSVECLLALQDYSQNWLRINSTANDRNSQAPQTLKDHQEPRVADKEAEWSSDEVSIGYHAVNRWNMRAVRNTADTWGSARRVDSPVANSPDMLDTPSEDSQITNPQQANNPPSPFVVSSRNLYDVLSGPDSDSEHGSTSSTEGPYPTDTSEDEPAAVVPLWRRSTPARAWNGESMEQRRVRQMQAKPEQKVHVARRIPRQLQSVRGHIQSFPPGSVVDANWVEQWIPSLAAGNANPGRGAWASPFGDMHGKPRYQIVYANIPANFIMKTMPITLHSRGNGTRANHAIMGPLLEGQVNVTDYEEVIEMEDGLGAVMPGAWIDFLSLRI
ncbi:hypothetical protein EJ08DRAFT_498788 [Tothia fuscella]|uniref:Uncharacterized protein n=1 Tax=Tothia fuscella TaxID=1048955 RepID=A0A9P4NZU9_9PEZI|nr:hypothetical protein EJ08DRAFT_498788 [Tothia fuscella]